MSRQSVFLAILPLLSLATFSANGVELPLNGIGLAEEMPISTLSLFLAEPKVVQNEERNFRSDDDDDDETGVGTIELMPVNSIKVNFNPPLENRRRPVAAAVANEDQVCKEVCHLPALPMGMNRAAKQCNTELVYENSFLPHTPKTREGRPMIRRLDTAHRTSCGSKCVLGRLDLLQANGIPDADKVTGYLLRAFGASWTESLRMANIVCSKVLRARRRAGQNPLEGLHTREDRECGASADFMKCIREVMTQECPTFHRAQDCHKKN